MMIDKALIWIIREESMIVMVVYRDILGGSQFREEDDW